MKQTVCSELCFRNRRYFVQELSMVIMSRIPKWYFDWYLYVIRLCCSTVTCSTLHNTTAICFRIFIFKMFICLIFSISQSVLGTYVVKSPLACGMWSVNVENLEKMVHIILIMLCCFRINTKWMQCSANFSIFKAKRKKYCVF